MSHQPFENWILDHEALPLEARRALQEHLQNCPQCQRLQNRWLAARQELRMRPMAAPAPGFTQRWQAGLAARRAREQRKQAWKIFAGFLGAAMILILALGVYTMVTSSPADLLTAVVRTLSSTRELVNLAEYAVRTWISSTPLALNLAIWIYLTVTLCLLFVAWLAILWRTKSVGVHNL